MGLVRENRKVKDSGMRKAKHSGPWECEVSARSKKFDKWIH